MYKYIKGTTILSEKRMSDSIEIARKYGLWEYGEDHIVPNGKLVEYLILVYISQRNYQTSDYYYISKSGQALRVYPEELVNLTMKDFIDYLEANNIVTDKDKVYDFNGYKFIYYQGEQENNIVGYEKFLKKRGDKK